MEDNISEALEEMNPDRRAFVKRVAAVTAFAVPMIASYDLQSLHSSTAKAAVTIPFSLSNHTM